MTDVFNMILALATVALALVAVIALMAESRNSRMALTADVMLRVQDKFDSPRMLKVRRRAVEAIQDFRNKKTETLSDDVDDVLDFFEEVALLVRRNVIDKRAARHAFYHWLDGYWWASVEYINTKREKDTTLWEDLCWLHSQLVQLKNEGEMLPPLADRRLTDEQVQEFLKEEERYLAELRD